MEKSNEFTLTPIHIKLIRRMNVRYDEDTEYGAPEIDPKRPYGNSDVEDDIREIVGKRLSSDDCLKLHKETEKALQIFLLNAQIEPVKFTRSNYYTDDWEVSK